MKADPLCVIAAVLISTSATLLGQQPVCRSTVMVTALDQRTNEPIDGLTISDLRAKLKGHELPIGALTPAPGVRRFVFVLDRSGSMTSDAHVALNKAVGEALDGIAQGDFVAFLAFKDKQVARTEFMQIAVARAGLPKLLTWKPETTGTRTPLWDSIDAALRMLSPYEKGDVIVVASDGGDNASMLGRSKIQAELLKARVPVMAIVKVNPYAPTPEERSAPAELAEFAQATGGTSAIVGSGSQWKLRRGSSPLTPSQLMSMLAHQFDMEVDIPPLHKPEEWQLRVASPEMATRTRLLYPDFLLPCAMDQ